MDNLHLGKSFRQGFPATTPRTDAFVRPATGPLIAASPFSAKRAAGLPADYFLKSPINSTCAENRNWSTGVTCTMR
jgi:hypothetical protein